jgi:hypothetical protein
MERTCSDCPASITVQSKTGRCRRCATLRSNADPAMIARRVEGNRLRRDTDPASRERHAQGCRDAAVRRMQDPVVAERMRLNGVEFGRWNFWRVQTPAAREKAKAGLRRAHLAWCPEEFWALNRKLKRNGYRLPNRKRIILEQVPGSPHYKDLKVANRLERDRQRREREKAQAY